MLLRSRLLIPMATPPMEDGAVVVEQGRIRAVGKFAELRADHGGHEVVDLGDRVLMPGFINAHCHLDYTQLAGAIPPTNSFTRWVQSIIALKAGWSYTDFAESWMSGVRMLPRFGTTTVGDIEAVPELIPDVLPGCKLRVVSFRELITVRSQKTIPQLVEASEADLLRTDWGHHHPGLSPHAPYSTRSELIPMVMQSCARHQWRWTMHIAESRDEWDMFHDARGPMLEWLSGQRDVSDCGKGSPVQWLKSAGGLRNDLIAVHVNHLGSDDASDLGRNGVHVVHCPVSHAYFQHQPFDYQALTKSGVNICLGTDSLASHRVPTSYKPTLNMFAEMQAFLRVHPEADPTMVLRWATLHGARGLGLQHETGQLAPGLSADMISIPCSSSIHELSDAVVHHKHPVDDCMVRGEWLVRQGQVLESAR